MRKIFIAISLISIVGIVAVPAFARGNPGSTCTPGVPRVSIDNTYAWGAKGSWGMPGETLTFAVNVFNTDSGCGTSTFDIAMSAPSGFAVAMPATVSVGSASSMYAWAQVTSPSGVADGDYPLTVSVHRQGVAGQAGESRYKVYSADSVGPELYWINPSDGGALSGRTAYVGFASKDDHAVRQLRVFLDGSLVAAKACDGVTFDCQVSYRWTIRRVRGQHSATFESADAMGNLSTSTSTFTVN